VKVVVTGATGFIGTPLCRALRTAGAEVVALTRRAAPARELLGEGIGVAEWDARSPGAWEEVLAGAQGVINLAGEPLVGRAWTSRQKEVLRASRVETTRALVAAMGKTSARPEVLLSASAVGYYGPHGDETLTEESPPGSDFLGGLVREWEAAAEAAKPLGVRVARLRLGVVLGEGGGALAKMAPPFRFFLGGPLGSGQQWVSWVHRDDVIGIALWALENGAVRGAVNVTAPQPVPMREFARALGRALGRPSWAPVPAPALRVLMGEMADVLLTGQRVLPEVARSLGYRFRFPDLDGALRSILGKG
jgi:uncharacterized protein (TIGR01777 family)